MPYADIHPEIRHRVWLNQGFGTPLMLAIAAGIYWSVIVAIMRGDDPWALLALRGSIGSLFVWAGWYVWCSGTRYRRMTWVLEHVPSIRVMAMLNVNARGGIQGSLYPADDAKGEGWFMMFSPPQWDIHPLDRTVLDAHIDPNPGGPIVLETPSGILWPLEGSYSKRLAVRAAPSARGA